MAIMPEACPARQVVKTPDGSQVLSPTGQSGTGQCAPQAREGRACSSLEQVQRTCQNNGLVTVDSEQARRSRRHASTKLAARLLADQCSRTVDPARGRVVRMKPVFLTLTYAEAQGWDRRDVSECLAAIKRQAKRQGHRLGGYAWVSELQQRGAIHYHVILWIPRAMRLQHPDTSGAWPHGMSNVEWKVDATAAASYLAAYCTKEKRADELAAQAGHRYPKGCRRHGCGGLSEPANRIRRYALLPQYMREQCTVEDDVRRAIGGGFRSKATGQHWESAWVVYDIRGSSVLLLPRESVPAGVKFKSLSRQVRDWITNAVARPLR